MSKGRVFAEDYLSPHANSSHRNIYGNTVRSIPQKTQKNQKSFSYVKHSICEEEQMDSEENEEFERTRKELFNSLNNNYDFDKSWKENLQSGNFLNNISIDVLEPLLNMEESQDYDDILDDFIVNLKQAADLMDHETSEMSKFTSSEEEELTIRDSLDESAFEPNHYMNEGNSSSVRIHLKIGIRFVTSGLG